TLEGDDQDGAGGHELDEAFVKAFALVGSVVGFGGFAGDLHELEAGDLEAFVFKAGEDLATEAALDGVGFEDDEGAFHDGWVSLCCVGGIYAPGVPKQMRR